MAKTIAVKGAARRSWQRRNILSAAPLLNRPDQQMPGLISRYIPSPKEQLLNIAYSAKRHLNALAAANSSIFTNSANRYQDLSQIPTSYGTEIRSLISLMNNLLLTAESLPGTDSLQPLEESETRDRLAASYCSSCYIDLHANNRSQSTLPPDQLIAFSQGSDHQKTSLRTLSSAINGFTNVQRSERPGKSDSCAEDSESDSIFDVGSDRDFDIDTHTDKDRVEVCRNTSEYYNQLISQFEADGPTLASRCDKTIKLIEAEKGKWELYCAFIEEGKEIKRQPDDILKLCHAPTFKSYLVWRCNSSRRIKKESSIISYWKNLSMFYVDTIKTWMNGAVLCDVNHWIPAVLTPMMGLETATKIKSGLFVDDLDRILHYLWVLDEKPMRHGRLRVQLALALVLAGATSTRPSALIENLRYKDVEFHIFPRGPEDTRSPIGMLVELNKTKRTAGKSTPAKYGFHEEDTLLHEPMMYMESLAFADEAFLNDFKGLKDIYDLIVPPGSDRIILQWKSEWRERFIFRDIQGCGDSVNVVLTKALGYATARKWLISLGRALGYQKQLEWYDLRRGSGKKLHEALTKEEADRCMGHLHGSNTFARFYATDYREVDVQQIVFGSESKRDIIHLLGRLIRHKDAPKELSAGDKAKIKNNPELINLREQKKTLQALMEKSGLTIETALDTKEGKLLVRRYRKYQRREDCLRHKLQDKCLSEKIQQFWSTVYSEEIERQLNGGQQSKYLAPPEIKYELPERARIANLFSKVADISTKEGHYQLRISLVAEMAKLSKLPEPPQRPETKTVRQKKTNFHTTIRQQEFDHKLKAVRQAKAVRPSSTTQTVPIFVTPTEVPGSNSQPDIARSTVAVANNTITSLSIRTVAFPVSTETLLTNIQETIAPTSISVCPFCQWDGTDEDLARHILGHLKGETFPMFCPSNGCCGILGSLDILMTHHKRCHR